MGWYPKLNVDHLPHGHSCGYIYIYIYLSPFNSSKPPFNLDLLKMFGKKCIIFSPTWWFYGDLLHQRCKTITFNTSKSTKQAPLRIIVEISILGRIHTGQAAREAFSKAPHVRGDQPCWIPKGDEAHNFKGGERLHHMCFLPRNDVIFLYIFLVEKGGGNTGTHVSFFVFFSLVVFCFSFWIFWW